MKKKFLPSGIKCPICNKELTIKHSELFCQTQKIYMKRRAGLWYEREIVNPKAAAKGHKPTFRDTGSIIL